MKYDYKVVKAYSAKEFERQMQELFDKGYLLSVSGAQTNFGRMCLWGTMVKDRPEANDEHSHD